MKKILMTLTVLALILSVGESFAQKKTKDKRVKDKSAQGGKGWTNLFDGTSTAGWRNYNSTTIGEKWKVEDGALMLDPQASGKGGDIITEKMYENFELELEWKIAACGNSGVFFGVIEDKKYDAVYRTGPEMQVLDNTCHPDAKIIKHRAGDLYDLISCSKETVKPAGEWNAVRLISRNGNYEFWLNGTKVVNFRMHTPEWDEMVKNSKFNEFPDFGKSKKGHLALQDHGDKVWYRNIRIKELN